MTDAPPMTDETTLQAKHAQLFKTVSDRLAAQAGQLVSLKDRPNLNYSDVACLYVGTGAIILVHEAGPAMAVNFLRQLADQIEAEPRTSN